MKTISIFLKTSSLLLVLFLVSLSSCKVDCDSPAKIYVNNYCDFSVALEVDIVGDSLYQSVLKSGESVSYQTGETRVNVKAGKTSV